MITLVDFSCHICRFFWRWSEIVTIDNVVFLPRTMALAIFKNYYLFNFFYLVCVVYSWDRAALPSSGGGVGLRC